MAAAADGGIERFGIGGSLREARLRRGLELADVERETCIRAANLAAIEDDRFEALPGDVYAVGFIRAYAEFLGLDGARYVAGYHRLRPAAGPPPLRLAAHATPQAPLPRALWLVAALVLAAAAAAAALVLLPRSHPRATPPARPPAPRTHRPKPTPPAAPAFPGPLTIRAAGGPSWVSVRLGGVHGRTLWQGMLAQGDRLRFGLRRPIWVGLGAPQLVTARIGAKQVRLAPARSRFLFSSRGVRRG